MVQAGSTAAACEVVVAQKQQLSADGIARLAQLLRQQPRTVSRKLLAEEQALDSQSAVGRSRRVRATRRRETSRRAGGAAPHSSEATRGNIACDSALHGHGPRSALAS